MLHLFFYLISFLLIYEKDQTSSATVQWSFENWKRFKFTAKCWLITDAIHLPKTSNQAMKDIFHCLIQNSPSWKTPFIISGYKRANVISAGRQSSSGFISSPQISSNCRSFLQFIFSALLIVSGHYASSPWINKATVEHQFNTFFLSHQLLRKIIFPFFLCRHFIGDKEGGSFD